jgi:hypothetical protein
MIGVSVGDAFKVIELCLKGLDYRTSRGRQLFNDHVDPCFKTLEEIHTDYLKALQDIQRKNVTIQGDLSELKMMWNEYSIIMTSSRESLKAISERWIEHAPNRTPQEVIDFFASVEAYFIALSAPDDSIAPSLYSLISRILKADAQISHETFEWFIQYLNESLKCRWRAVSAAHAGAKIALLR